MDPEEILPGQMFSYGEPDPEFPLPGVPVGFDGARCNDDDQLERWRLCNDTHRTQWTLEEDTPDEYGN